MRAPVSVCIIVKNEPFLEQCIKSFRDYVEELVIVDTGSTDGTTIEVAKKYADIFESYSGCNNPQTGLIEDFSDARNRSFDLATKPWILWADSDDRIEGAEKLPYVLVESDPVKLQLEGVGILFPYEYAYDDKGKCICRHYRERLFYNRKLFNWMSPVHEVVVPDNTRRTALITREELLFKHNRQYSPKQQEPGRNLRILRAHFEKNKDDARQMYYLGLECANAGFIDEALAHLEKYVSISGWDDERAMACLKIVDLYRAQNKNDLALQWAFRIIEIKENWCEGYFSVAKIFYHLADTNANNSIQNYWAKVVHFIRVGFTMPATQSLLFLNPTERACDIHQYYNMALNKLGSVQEALDSVNLGLLASPEDKNFNLNKKLYEAFLARRDATNYINKLKDLKEIDELNYNNIIALMNNQIANIQQIPQLKLNNNEWNVPNSWDFDGLPLDITDEQLQSTIIMLWKQYMLHDDIESAIMFLENTPNNVKNSFAVKKALEFTKACLNPGGVSFLASSSKLDIVFFAGDGVEIWTPETVKQTGIGGSELMMLELAKRLASFGHRVRIYNSCGNDSSIHDGVEYNPSNRFKNLVCDVLIVSRQASMLGDQFNIKTKLRLLWVHDVYAIGATDELLMKADRILALSQWHKSSILAKHGVHPDQVIVTRNGINLDRFNKTIKRNRFKCVNSSSPDRSWPVLLQVWPEIKKQVPQAEIHLFYGFRNWEFLAPHYPGQMDLINQLKNKIKEMEPLDVVFRDRVNQEKLAEEFLSAGVWAHPTWFTESSCITGMEAQAAGLRCVSSSIAALNETVGNRGVLIDGDWTTQEYQKKFIDATVAALLKENDDKDRLELQKYAKDNFGLDSLAKNWENMFYNLLDELKTNSMIPYEPTVAYRK